eukprot:972417-Amphidinium_carterae.1
MEHSVVIKDKAHKADKGNHKVKGHQGCDQHNTLLRLEAPPETLVEGRTPLEFARRPRIRKRATHLALRWYPTVRIGCVTHRHEGGPR